MAGAVILAAGNDRTAILLLPETVELIVRQAIRNLPPTWASGPLVPPRAESILGSCYETLPCNSKTWGWLRLESAWTEPHTEKWRRDAVAIGTRFTVLLKAGSDRS